MRSTATALSAAAEPARRRPALARARASAPAPIKVGLMLPYTGTFAALGNAIENGFKLYVQEQGGKLGGREIQYFKVDDESEPSKATDNVNKLIKRDNVDVLVGTVHSGVALAMAKAAKDNNTLLDHPERRRRRDHRPDVRRQHRAQLVLELAAGLRDGRGRGAEGRQAGDDDHLELRRRRRIDQGLHRGLREGRRQGHEGPEPAVPERRVPGAADRDRGAEARCGLRVLRRRRRGQVRQGLRRRGPQQDDPALRPGLPHRRHARGAGRIGAGHADDAALRRQPRHAAEQRVPQGLRARLQVAAPTSTRCRATTRRRSSAPA